MKFCFINVTYSVHILFHIILLCITSVKPPGMSLKNPIPLQKLSRPFSLFISLSNRRSEHFWKQNFFHFLGLGSGVDGNPDLGLGGDIVRYLFSIFPVFNFSYSLIGLGQTQAENNICLNYVRTHHMFSRILK